jgi:antitoxin ParD1/3/4
VFTASQCQSLTRLANGDIHGTDPMPLNVNLTPQLETLVRKKVSSGRYNSASEVVREALRLMEAQDELRTAKLEQLRREIREGMESGPPKSWDTGEMKRAGRKQLAVRSSPSRK